MILLTSDYYDDVLEWTANDRPASEFPVQPSVETLNGLFASSLKPYKAIGDQIIYTPAKFKKLFGSSADVTLQGTFINVPCSVTSALDPKSFLNFAGV